MDRLTEDMRDKTVCRLPEEVIYKASLGDAEASRLLAEEELARARRYNESDPG